MKALEIHLKSGGVLVVDADYASTRRSEVEGGGFTQIKWETPPDAKRKLHSINPEDISAVVVIL